MSITVLNYMDHALVSRINEQAAKRAEAAKQSNTDDFAAALADSTKALKNSQNTHRPVPQAQIHQGYPQPRQLHPLQIPILQANLTLFLKRPPIPMVFLLLY